MLQDDAELTLVTTISLVVGLGAIVLFVIRQLRLDVPILEVRVMKTPIIALVSFIAILAFTLLIAFEKIMTMFIQNAKEYSAYYGGLVVMPGALTLEVISFTAIQIFDH